MAWQVRVYTNGNETASFIQTQTHETREAARQFVADNANRGFWEDAANTFWHPRQRRAYSVEEV